MLLAAAGRLPESGDGVSPLTPIAERLRSEGVPVVETGARAPRLFQLAEQLGAPALAFVGEEELARGELSLRELGSREQTRLPFAEAADRLRRYYEEQP